jgi:hypothetical protein
MTKTNFAVVFALLTVGGMFIAQRPVQTQAPTLTRDAATTVFTANLLQPPTSVMLMGTQGSSSLAFRARPLIACDQHASRDLRGPGGFGLAGEVGKNVYVCSYSISNAGAAQEVQFISGTEVSSGGGSRCNPGGMISGKFYLAPNQFVSQGSGVGSLFRTDRQGLCLQIAKAGNVSVKVTYATFYCPTCQ